MLQQSGQLKAGKYDLDFDHEFIPTEKYDTKYSYKKERGYFPGIATIGEMLVGIENRDANTNVRFHQKDILGNIFERLARRGAFIDRCRMDCGSFSEETIRIWYTDSAASFIYGLHAAKHYMNECLNLKIRMRLKSTLRSMKLPLSFLYPFYKKRDTDWLSKKKTRQGRAGRSL